jgi:hypothetical protein
VVVRKLLGMLKCISFHLRWIDLCLEDVTHFKNTTQLPNIVRLEIVYVSLSQYFYPGGTLEIIFRSQGTRA